MAWYAQSLEALPPTPSSIPPGTPSVTRTPSLGPDYGRRAVAKARPQHERQHQASNPLMPLLSQAFQNYRKKQADKPDQKWPDALEGHFLDGK